MSKLLRKSAEPSAATHRSEQARLGALERLDVMDAPHDETCARVVSLIRSIFDVPIAHVALMDAHRQVYLASEGLTSSEAPRPDTFCRHVLLKSAPLVIEDAAGDPRFADNPFVAGDAKIRFYAGVPLQTRDGYAVGTVCALDTKPRTFSAQQTDILSDLARLVMADLELRRLAQNDGLTGLLSRRAFRELAERDFALAMRHDQPLSAIAIDLDHFKSINDSYGHAAGDSVLVEVAKVCAEAVRHTDRVGRLGGEEFAILLPDTGMDGAVELAEKLRMAIARLRFSFGDNTVRVTSSFGAAVLDQPGIDLDALLARADLALYAAKAAGRNQCQRWRSNLEAGQTARRRVLKAGVLHFNNRMSMLDCTVRSLGKDGAGIDVTNAFGLPQRVNLLIRADGFDRPCRVVVQRERHIEVVFE